MEVRVCLMLQPLFLWGNNPHYPQNRRLGGNQRWSGCSGEEEDLVPARNQTPYCPAHNLLTILSYCGSQY